MGGSRATLPGESSFRASGSPKPYEAPCVSVSFIMSSTRHLVTVGMEVVNDEWFERLGHQRDTIPFEFDATFDPNTALWVVHSAEGSDHPPHPACHIPTPVKRRQTRRARAVGSPSPSQALPGPDQPVYHRHHPDTAIAPAATAEPGQKQSSPVTSAQTHHHSNPQDATNQSTDQQGIVPVQENRDCNNEIALPATTRRGSDWWSVVF
ncbi:uncharacterized protein PV07_08883 [Cladophialophora immunda]|uniref:Uncharacterized protein n=1 Tax=Cladophialophora immunda TaxID=569365 RepID=A0A0D2C3D0_9EURO|nr:uncharacterized protein PV07_08883 [Cladophialophora immunda]KIW25728.1 hypothetical protein PV07_08883 [Cladophialophora immunda]OQU96281.1 hypothetical protein CLAIMM_02388 [Cladophialophora immunda]